MFGRRHHHRHADFENRDHYHGLQTPRLQILLNVRVHDAFHAKIIEISVATITITSMTIAEGIEFIAENRILIFRCFAVKFFWITMM